MRYVLPVFVGAVSLLLASGCGGSSSSSSTTTATVSSATVSWADGMCTALVQYRSALRSARTSIRSNGLSKAGLNEAADGVRTATKSFVADIGGLGKPQTSSGASAQQALSQLSVQLQTEANAVQEVASNGTPTLSVVSTVQTALAHAKSELTTAVEHIKQLDTKGDLKSAFAQAPACANAVGT